MRKEIKDFFTKYEARPLFNIRESSVLIPFIKGKDGEWHLLYQVRSQHVSQAGDSSFPGGRIEEGESSEEAAIRETIEELQIERDQLHILGEFDYIVGNNAIIHAYIGLIDGLDIEEIHPDPAEVEQVYSLPLSYLLQEEPERYRMSFAHHLDPDFPRERLQYAHEARYSSREEILYYPLEDYFLWGYTASLTYRLVQVLKEMGFPREYLKELKKEDSQS